MGLSLALSIMGALGAVGTISTLWALYRGAKEKGRADRLESENTRLLDQIGRQKDETMRAHAQVANTEGQKEEAIAWYRKQIATLEADLDACVVPGATRERLRRMLGGPDKAPDLHTPDWLYEDPSAGKSTDGND